jgi:hypothetical protein
MKIQTGRLTPLPLRRRKTSVSRRLSSTTRTLAVLRAYLWLQITSSRAQREAETFVGGHALACADLDDDGNDEIVVGYRGAATSLCVYYCAGLLGAKWECQTLDTARAAAGVVIAGLNGDCQLAVVAMGTSTGDVKWYENLIPG